MKVLKQCEQCKKRAFCHWGEYEYFQIAFESGCPEFIKKQETLKMVTNFEKITKTQKTLAKFLSELTIKHGCVNCPAHACGCSAENCKQKWEEWLAEVEGKVISNFGWITLCPEELANFITHRLGIELECRACPVTPGDNDADERWNTITDWLKKEVDK